MRLWQTPVVSNSVPNANHLALKALSANSGLLSIKRRLGMRCAIAHASTNISEICAAVVFSYRIVLISLGHWPSTTTTIQLPDLVFGTWPGISVSKNSREISGASCCNSRR